MSYQTAVSGLDWSLVTSGSNIPAAGIAAMQTYEQGLGRLLAGNYGGQLVINLATSGYNGSVGDELYDVLVLSGAINGNRTVNLFFDPVALTGSKGYTVLCPITVASGGPYNLTLATVSGINSVSTIVASGSSIQMSIAYVDPKGSVYSSSWAAVATSGITSNIIMRWVLTSGTSFVPSVSGWYDVEVQGGGGGSSHASSTILWGGSGGGGGYAKKRYWLNSGTSYTYAVGLGGSGSTYNNDNSTAGGNSTFSDGTTIITAGGGARGQYASSSSGAGGSASNGDINIPGSTGQNNKTSATNGGYQRAGGGSSLSTMLIEGSIGSTTNDYFIGTIGQQYGGGATGGDCGNTATPGMTGKAGANGVVIISRVT